MANLDAEESWARIRRPGLPRPNLSRAARRRMAAVGSLLRIFCRPQDRLWLPGPLDAQRLPIHPGLPRPELEFGEPKGLAPTESLQVWGCTPDWVSSVSTVEIAARVNDRAHTFALAQRLGLSLAGSRFFDSFEDFEGFLELELPELSRSGGSTPWVLKAPLSAAGRSRLIHDPKSRLRPQEKSIRRLFHQHGSLLWEPWLERTDDYGLLLEVGPSGAISKPQIHRQQIGPTGGFLGIELTSELGLSDEQRERVEKTARNVADHLAKDGYRGPVGIDFWRYRRSDGRLGLNPLGEINARMTFGRVARALAETLFPSRDPTTTIRLIFGAPPKNSPSRTESLPLLLAGDSPEQPETVWLEVESQ